MAKPVTDCCSDGIAHIRHAADIGFHFGEGWVVYDSIRYCPWCGKALKPLPAKKPKEKP
jgi:hypothetical protein